MCRCHHANLTKQCQHHRELEGQAKGQNQHHHEVEIGLDVWHQSNSSLPVRASARRQRVEKLYRHWQQEEIDQCRAQHKKYGRCKQIGSQYLPLGFIEARRHEFVHLCCNQRKCNEHATKHCNLQFHQKYTKQLDRNQADVCAGAPFEGLDQQRQQIRRKIETHDKGKRETRHRPHQPAAQFKQVVHQRRFRGVDFVFAHELVATLLPPTRVSPSAPVEPK